jgi:hypothetical protein
VARPATSFSSIACMARTAGINAKGLVLKSTGKSPTVWMTPPGTGLNATSGHRHALFFCVLLTAFCISAADKILIEKQARRLSLLSKGEVIKSYKIALGGNPVGPKERQGDNKTPEGVYRIDARNGNSDFHLSLHISYPNEHDKKRAKKLGVSPGGDIMIHGIKNGFSAFNFDLALPADTGQGCKCPVHR